MLDCISIYVYTPSYMCISVLYVCMNIYAHSYKHITHLYILCDCIMTVHSNESTVGVETRFKNKLINKFIVLVERQGSRQI